MKRNVNYLAKMVWPVFILLLLIPQLASADEVIDLVPGLNVVNYPVQVPPAYTSHDFLNDLRVIGDVVSIQRFNRTSGVFQTTTWDAGDLQPSGAEFPINNEEAYFVFSEEALSLTFTGSRNCVSVNLKSGYNLVGFPCADGLTAHFLMTDLGDSSVQNIKRLDPATGEMQTAFWNSGAPDGDNFSLVQGEGYQVTMLADEIFTVPTPDPPGSLVGYPGDNKVALAWQPPPGWNTPGGLMLTGYNVYRGATTGGPYTKLNADPLTHPSYSDESAVNGTTYFYVVTALGVHSDESGASNEAETTPFTTGPTDFGGTIEQPATLWTLAQSPYIITENTTFLSYSTLTIEPGVEVRVDGNYSINFYGNVQTLGTFANPIVFTSNKPSPARGDWAGINIVEDGVSSVFKYCTVEYAQVGFDISFGAPTISHCVIRQSNDRGINLISTVDGLIEYNTFENNSSYGIVVNWDSNATIQYNTISGSQYGIYVARSAPLIQGNTLQGNSSYGLYVDLRGNPEVYDNLITANSSYGVYVKGNNTLQNNPNPILNANRMHGNGGGYDLYLWDFGGDRITQVIDVTGNWWGTNDARTIGSRIYDYNDNNGEGVVADYRGFLAAEGGDPVSGNFIIAQRIETDTTWTAAASPFHLIGRVHVAAGAALTIEPAVDVRFYGVHFIQVWGKLAAQGTDTDGILFTSNKSTPARGDWGGIYFYPGSDDDSILSYCTIEYADTYSVYASGASPTVSNSLIQQGDDRGFQIVDGSQANIVDNSVLNNRNYGIVMAGGSDAVVSGNEFTGHAVDGIYVESSSPVLADNDVQSNSRYGIYIRFASSPTVTGNTVANNNSYGIYVQGNANSEPLNPSPVITGNRIFGNRTYDLYTFDFGGDRINIQLNATGNWWGTADVSTIGARVYDYNDNTGECPVVNYGSFLASDGGPPVTDTLIAARRLTSNTTWTAAGSPYRIIGRIEVPQGITLTVEPGAVVRFSGPYLIQVWGKLVAQGTDSERILFSSDKGSPAMGDWGGIFFYPGSDDSSIISYSTIEYADNYGVYCSAASPTVSFNIIQHCDDRGIYLTDGSRAQIVNNTVRNNRYYGIVIDKGSDAMVSGNEFTGHQRDGIHINTASPTISDNNTHTNTRYGLYILYDSSPTVTGNTIANNNSYGIYLQGNNSSETQNPAPVLNGNRIFGNRTYDLYTFDFIGSRIGIAVNATGNWWGSADARAIGARIYDYNDNVNEGPVVDYTGFLDGDGGNPVSGNYLLAQQISADTTWGNAGGPYTVLGRIEIAPGATLNIDPGTEFRFTGLYYLLVHGKLLALGNGGNRILFTSDKPTPARGDWGGIYFYDDSDDASILSYATVEYAQQYSIYCANASPTIDNVTVQEGSDRGMFLTTESRPTVSQSTFQNNANYGIYMDGGSAPTISGCSLNGNRYGIYMTDSAPDVTGCEIRNNTSYGIWVQRKSTPAISGNTIRNNNTYGIYVQGNNSVFENPRPVINANSIYDNGSWNLYVWDFGGDRLGIRLDATGNWWGSSDARFIGQRIYDYNDNANEGPVVDFLNFLDGAGGSPVTGNFLLAQRIFSDTTWQQNTSPAIVVGRQFLLNGVELTIEAGTEIQFAGPYQLHVYGKLSSQGTAGAPVIFTSDKLSPARGDWQGLVFYDDSDDDSRLDYTVVEFAVIGLDLRTAAPTVASSIIASASDKGIWLRSASTPVIEDGRFFDNYNQALYIAEGSDATVRRNVVAETARYDGIYIQDSSPLIQDNVIEENTRHGIYVYINSNPTISGNTIVNNNSWGIRFQGSNNAGTNPLPVLNGNNIFDNLTYDLRTESYGTAGSVTLDATGNWWGTTVVGEIENRIYHNPDNAGSPLVDYGTFASAAVGIPAVYQVTIDDTIFSPESSPGAQDAVTIDGTITKSADWTVTIIDDTGNVIRTFSGTGTNFSVVWNGKDAGDAFVADGQYSVLIDAVESGDTSLIRLLLAEVDNTPPLADIDDTFNGAVLEKIIEVLGSAADVNFTDYELEYGPGAAPTEWNRIGNIGSAPILDDLLETWLTNDETTDTAYFTNGDYTLRLTVRDDAGNSSDDTALVTLDNLYISTINLASSTVDLGQAETADVAFTLNKGATVSMKIYPEGPGVAGALVKEVTQVFGAAGGYTLSWDGTDGGGQTVPDEAYIYVLDAVSGVRTDAYRPTGGQTVGGGSGSIDPLYNAYVNDYWQMDYNHYAGPGRVSMQVTPAGQSAFWVFQNKPLEAGITRIVWDGRGPDGLIIDASVNVYFAAPTRLRPNYIITTGAAPAISGQAPFIEVKTNPYLAFLSYGQFSRMTYNIDQDANVTVKLLPPNVGDPNDSSVLTLVDNQALTAGDHELLIDGLDTTDPDGKSLLIEADGAYTLVIEAVSPSTGVSGFWRASMTLNQ